MMLHENVAFAVPSIPSPLSTTASSNDRNEYTQPYKVINNKIIKRKERDRCKGSYSRECGVDALASDD